MRKIRLFSVFVFLMLATVVGVRGTAIAGNATQYHVSVSDATIPWGFPVGEVCQEFPQPLDIGPDDFASDRVKHATEVVKSNGTKQVVVTDLVKGTASDEFGGTYTFVYQNDATFVFDGSTISVSMKDTFQLKGPTSYVVGFNWRWAYPANSLDVLEVTDGNGQVIDLVVDPFVFATSDGVNEDPGIVAGSWQQLSTRGDPVNCDPL